MSGQQQNGKDISVNVLLQSIAHGRHRGRRDASKLEQSFDEIPPHLFMSITVWFNGLVTNAAVRMSARRKSQAFVRMMYV